MKPNAIKNDIRAGKTIAGAMVFEFFSPGMASILANAGCKFVLYDMEHTGLGYETLKWLFASCRGLPIEPMVRVPRGEYTWLARALDLGARGVMIPMVESAAQARSIVEACRYPPVGRRGAAFGFAQCDYLGGDVGQKISEANARTMVIAQIETDAGWSRSKRSRRSTVSTFSGWATSTSRTSWASPGSSATRGSTPRCARWPRSAAGMARPPASWRPTARGSSACATWATR